ncbi:MAG TPA: 3-dehydroquinate synthase, partial [Clostridiales bacterium]|nr:3-dehydroquinate synthase [Clostridiales bacterium]
NNFNELYNIIDKKDYKNRKFMIITDSNVSKFYLNEIINLFKQNSTNVFSYIIQAGESSKTLDSVSLCYEELIKEKFDRNDVLIALGGGVIGDLTGFIAATYLRGIKFIQVPTSLLAMVDSSIGGKTGVDFKAYKNMVGAFYKPELVYINLSTLNTLKDLEFNSGMSEVIKHGLIRDKSYYQWLNENISLIKDKNITTLKDMIFKSCEIKKAVVEEDPKEKGIRALLNYGHTIGHSVEKLMNFTLLHGECVSIGIIAASLISLEKGYITTSEYNDIKNILDAFEQPTTIKNLLVDDIIEITKSDKKMDGNQIKFVLLKSIGNAYVDNTITEDEMKNVIIKILKEG